MEINTHGFEVDENEHDVVDRVYSELTPMMNPTPWVRLLRNRAGDKHKFQCMDSEDWKIANYIETLEKALEAVIDEYDSNMYGPNIYSIDDARIVLWGEKETT